MDYGRIFALSAAGMQLERTRLEVAAMNLAYAHSPQHPSNPGYQPLRVVSRAAFAGLVETGEVAPPIGSVEAAPVAVRLVQEPGHPLADEQGFVAYPGVDPATEMVSLMTALRSYEANVAALNTARALALKTLEIGRGG
ncbi:flagellar basal body rod protein FlgC [Ramlibacter sp. G-1-2-2]|uniref:Flagellar basal body rod protein FlgC n=1 Tax=Ramlibacter agri TaxID=2728837 RepID=A0A848GZW3_9BURK|nr:flagellar basal body rod C-terminal domain-containing protein [Ramlibacter agri]NML42921.1 flagellar basal body rod protein FlgC [Ramlibacter agri]